MPCSVEQSLVAMPVVKTSVTKKTVDMSILSTVLNGLGYPGRDATATAEDGRLIDSTLCVETEHGPVGTDVHLQHVFGHPFEEAVIVRSVTGEYPVLRTDALEDVQESIFITSAQMN